MCQYCEMWHELATSSKRQTQGYKYKWRISLAKWNPKKFDVEDTRHKLCPPFASRISTICAYRTKEHYGLDTSFYVEFDAHGVRSTKKSEYIVLNKNTSK